MFNIKFYMVYPFLLFLLFLLAIYMLGRSLLPLLIAVILAYLCYPIVEWLQKKHLPRSLSILIVIMFFFSLISIIFLIIVPALYLDIQNIITRVPEVLNKAVIKIEDLARFFGLEEHIDRRQIETIVREQVENMGIDFVRPATDIIRKTLGGLMGTIIGFLNLFLIPVFFYFILSNLENMRREVISLVPNENLTSYIKIAKSIDRVLGGFIRGQLLVCLIVGILSAIGFWIAGVPMALAVGVVAGIFNIIPYLGPVLGYLTALIVSIGAGLGTLSIVVLTSVYVIIQTVESMVIAPKVVGDKVGIPPIMALIAALIGANALGIIGAIFAIPTAGILRVVYYELKQLYFQSLTNHTDSHISKSKNKAE